jgi:sulfonate transport system substrate-binding protein
MVQRLQAGLTRRYLLGAVPAGLAMGAIGRAAWAAEPALRIGYQKYGTLIIAKARGTIEEKLAPLGVKVTWAEFLGGPALLEAMGAGSIDFGTTGDTPPIFAQAAGIDLAYLGVEPASPHGLAIIVRDDSPVRSVTDLKGKRVALNKGSNVHNLLVRALASENLTVKDIQPVYLKPSDARPAYETGSVDAWVIWDPFLAAAETAIPSRKIADGVTPDGRVIDQNLQFFLASRAYARANPAILRSVLAALSDTETWAEHNRAAVVDQLAPAMGMDPAAVTRAIDRLGFGVKPIDAAIIASQQEIADTFRSLDLIPRKIDVAEARFDLGV